MTFVFVLPRIANYRQVWDVVRSLSWPGLLALAVVTALNLVTFAPPWMIAMPGLGFQRAFIVTQASTASTYIAPGGAAPGIALSYAMLRGWGYPGGEIGLAVAVIGVWNQLVLLGFPAIALALLTLTGGHNPLLQTTALFGLALFCGAVAAFAAGLSSRRLALAVGDAAARWTNALLRLARRHRVVGWSGESFAAFRARALGLLRRRWHVLTLTVLAGQLTVFVVLLTCLRVLDVGSARVSAIEAFAAWSLVRLLGSLPITPGGLGVVELALTSLLIGFGGPRAGVVAAVLIYRFLTIVPTLVLGLLAGLTWGRHHPARQRPAGYPRGMQLPDEVRDLFAGPNFAHLALILPSGSPHTSAIWAGVEDGNVVFFTRNETRIGNLERDPRVALSVTDHGNPYRSAWVRGRIAERLDGDDAQMVIDRLARKYTGDDFPVRGGSVFVVAAERAKATELPFVHRPGAAHPPEVDRPTPPT